MSTLVRGHGLQHEGRPVLAQACCAMNATTHGQRNYYDKHGHGICSCGAMSPHEDTHAARQQWHREHKAAVRAASQPAESAKVDASGRLDSSTETPRVESP